MGPLRADTIFSDLSKELDKNRATLAKKVSEMARRVVANKTGTTNLHSNALANIGIKVSVSTLCRDSQRPANSPLPTHGTPPFF